MSPLPIQNILAELNEQQRLAVEHGDDPLLIVAGAGTGKTATLAHRVAYRIAMGTDPSRILLLTFTRRAAAEMLRRVEGILRRLEAETRAQNALAGRAEPESDDDEDFEASAAAGRAGPAGGAMTIRNAGRVWGGTFHATATRLLRLHGRSIGLDPSFTILDRGDAEDLMGVLRTDLGLAKSDRRFPLKGTCMDIYSRCVNARETVEEAVEVHFPWCKDEVEDLRKLFAAYVDRKGEQSVLDYDDLLLFWHGLLTDSRAARSIRSRFDCVLVDEYQDTNVLQAEILAMLCPEGKSLTVVGDDAQAIYSFRAATVRNILDFPRQFPDTTVVTLEQNYRSTQPILDATNDIIAAATERHAKNLWSRRLEGGKPQLVCCEDEDEQSEYIIQRVLDHREAGIPSAPPGRALSGFAPQPGPGAGTSTPEHPVSQIRRLALRGDGARQGPARLLASGREPQRPHGRHPGAHAPTRRRAQEGPRPHEQPGGRSDGCLRPGDGAPLPDAQAPRPASNFSAWAGKPAPSPAAASAWEGLVALMTSIGSRDPGDLASQIKRIRLFYAPLLERLYDNARARILDLEQLEGLATRSPDRARFLVEIALDPPSYTEDLAGPPLLDEDFLILSTMHSAKGLEWDCIYVIHAADGNIPSDMATGRLEEIEEERRLFYVALTRAKDWLYVCYPLRYYTYPRSFSDVHGYAQLTRFLPEGVRRLFDEVQAFTRAADAGDPGLSPAPGTGQAVTMEDLRQRLKGLF